MSETTVDHDEVIAKLVLEQSGHDPDSEFTELLSFAARNDAELPLVNYLVEHDLLPDSNDDIRDQVERLQRDRVRYLDELRELDCLFDGNDVPYVVIKTRMLHEFQPWDLNVLVPSERWSTATNLLTEHGWRRTGLREHPLARTEPGKRLYKHGEKYPVHLHKHVSWNGIVYLPAANVISSRVREEEIFYPDLVTDTIIHCAHSVFENYKLTLGEAYQIQQVLGKNPEQDRAVATEQGWERGYDLALQTAVNVMDVLDAGETPALPNKYPTKALLKAWNQHAWWGGYGPYELSAHSFLYALK